MFPSKSIISVHSLDVTSDVSHIDAGTQTVIRVHPHILESTNEYASVRSEKKSQTTVSKAVTTSATKFISLLKYTPIQDIQEGSIRTVTIPKKSKLQFAHFASGQSKPLRILSLESSLSDDDGVGYVVCDVYQRLMRGKPSANYVDTGTQTELTAHPHILTGNKLVATITNDNGAQTQPRQYTCQPKKQV